MKKIRIAFTGGGTGGHIYPLLAVAEEVKEQLSRQGADFELLYFGSPEQYVQDFLKLNIRIVKIVPFKIRRYFSVQNIIDFFKFPFALVQAFVKMFFVMPDVLFSKGGTGAVAVVCAAWFYRVPIFIHESDSIPGRSSNFSFNLAKRVGISFDKTSESFKGDKVALVGNPVRSFLSESDDNLTPDKAKKIFGFDPTIPLILVLGGSQGAVRINEFMIENVKEFVGKYQVLHQVGSQNFKNFKNELTIATEKFIPAERERYKIVDFLQKEIKDAMTAADVIVSRAGSGAIFEIALMKKPSILIPLSESAGDHQKFNAYEYAKSGACIVLEDSNLSPALFFGQLNSILENKTKYGAMSVAAGTFSKPDAAKLIAKELINLAR
jgi:UDP-N-acetylglucosamine--N-acetylmuramyl-(pentapeptide) pyrophosphoryl-undecaprenol N-acetylglucosamine transferase